ncbi:hypothetical protein B1L02_09915 [Pseudoalteromonas piscicida]|uniref:Uncharacterized protein n=1 Tax=Pseudoalteromonas piscicida TaxID=43662 RepID=A0AAD0RG39_PSEO7|nr:hypothetical protein B1L02_09915 [Pseudoalteromonas piscicida]AXQ98276.1 hypothetical protein D0N37_11355 [Pseudoalteromonas piscicida]AXR01995.1 hypothetical protein D0511_07850 [Pseudoalteromonas piscicida]
MNLIILQRLLPVLDNMQWDETIYFRQVAIIYVRWRICIHKMYKSIDLHRINSKYGQKHVTTTPLKIS